MVGMVQEGNKEKKIKGGRKNKLREEGMLLMALEYLREYSSDK
jgi:transposase